MSEIELSKLLHSNLNPYMDLLQIILFLIFVHYTDPGIVLLDELCCVYNDGLERMSDSFLLYYCRVETHLIRSTLE